VFLAPFPNQGYDDDHMQLALEDIETSLADHDTKAVPSAQEAAYQRSALPAHLPRVHVTERKPFRSCTDKE
jgi:hypothetical protein